MSHPHSSSSMFHGANNNTFHGSTFNMKSESTGFNMLKEAVSPSAFHSYVGRPDPGRCYPDTRVGLLKGLEKWAMGMESPAHLLDPGWHPELEPRDCHILWLRGGAGVGKSAVAQTFAEQCEDLGHIVASFFFFSQDPARNVADHLVATLAYQIAKADAGAKAHIETIVHEDPHIFNLDFTKQIVSLIINPIQRAAGALLDTERHQRRCIIIIDGLDECAGSKVQTGIVRAISSALRLGTSDLESALPRFLICSRPEEPIHRIFRSSHLRDMHTSLDLSSDDDANDDIYNFLEGKFDEIRNTHSRRDLIPAGWPSSNDVESLVHSSSGHFIYAETVVKIIDNDPRPATALAGILGVRAMPQRVREPFAELDELYRHILRRAQATSNMKTIQLSLGLLCLGLPSQRPSSTDVIEKFLGLNDGDLDVLLATISSLVHVPTNVFNSIYLYHKSFNDFLRDESRGGEFYICENAILEHVWDRCTTLASHGANLGEDLAWFVGRCADDYHRSYDLPSAGRQRHSLLGMTQRRDFLAFTFLDYFKDFWIVSGSSWAVRCFEYWHELLATSEDSDLIEQATTVMIMIIKDLKLGPGPTIPLLACQKMGQPLLCLPSQEYKKYMDFTDFLSDPVVQQNFTVAKNCLEDEQMGDCRLTGDSFADACVFWMAYLRKIGRVFDRRMKRLLQNERGLLVMQHTRRNRPIFWHDRTWWALRRYRKTGRIYFFLTAPPHPWISTETGSRTRTGPVFKGYMTDKLLFRPNMRGNQAMLQEFGHRRRSQGGGTGSKNPLFKVQSLLRYQHAREREFGFIISRIPSMLEQASKSDAVAALGSKAFPPLCKYYRKLTQNARRAMEEYAVRHGYDSPYADAGPKSTTEQRQQSDPFSGMAIELTSGDVILSATEDLQPPLGLGLQCATLSGVKTCDEPGCNMVISESDVALHCSSPDCNRKYHLRCQGMTQAPLADWFCDIGCERDSETRKHIRSV